MTTPHRHAELIKAWADNPQLQFQHKKPYGKWLDCVGNPAWHEDTEYRIKPERVFPKTTLTIDQMLSAYFGVPVNAFRRTTYGETANVHMRRVADAAIKQYILDTEKA